MVLGSLSGTQTKCAMERGALRKIGRACRAGAVLLSIALAGCSTWPGGTYRNAVSGRSIEFKSGTAYLTEGRSTQAIPYEVDGDKVILKLPMTREVLRRMPDGSISFLGEPLVKVEGTSNL